MRNNLGVKNQLSMKRDGYSVVVSSIYSVAALCSNKGKAGCQKPLFCLLRGEALLSRQALPLRYSLRFAC
jgi:hypothetical protein